ncbi:terminase small subunit [Azospirillum melinis]|uniref:Terminase small subunit n=1 Tax=Azospirillum melinis TaxID=328839 RepID=A0ABX2KNQ6_9PROT|nr:terminase small subunit [Azospirillum melinis]MBP2309277.1 phage terminase small subunit [Azospirillum melinis]NUB04341.1 terminase small subunit [Azospirillum melinis]
MSLTPKQLRFVEAYLLDPNGKKAAIAAGYSEKNAAVEASRLLTHAKVVAELERRRILLQTRTGITPERVLSELAKLGFADIRDVVQWRANVQQVAEDPETGEPLLEIGNEVVITDSSKLSADAAAAILEVSQTKDGALKVRMHDKLGALVKIGQHLGMFRPVGAPEEKGKKEKAAEDARAVASLDAWGDDLAFNGARPN